MVEWIVRRCEGDPMCNSTQVRPLATPLLSLPANLAILRDLVPPNLAYFDLGPEEAAHHA